ncbi:MAG: hypothetical protein RL379_636 [Bacillota bacterium]|jgi:uncharacterized RDD family membrane protein YckC
MKTNPFAVPANLLKRTGAAVLDLFLWLISSLILLSYVFGPLYDAQYGTTQLSDQFVAYQEASYLYATDEVSNQLVNLDLTDVPEALYQYYSIFKDGKVYQVDEPAFEFSNGWFNENVLIVNETDTLFELVNNDPTVVAVLKTGLSQTEIDAFYTEAYRLALVDFNTYPPFSSLVNLINGYFLEIIGYSAVLSFLIFYILIPLLFKQGVTLGKRASGIMVVTDKGYTMKWWQLPLRSLVLAATLVTALYTIFGSLLLSYTLMVFTKGYRSANDFLSSTKIVDQKSSKIFVDEQTLLAYENQLERSQTQDSTRYIK